MASDSDVPRNVIKYSNHLVYMFLTNSINFGVLSLEFQDLKNVSGLSKCKGGNKLNHRHFAKLKGLKFLIYKLQVKLVSKFQKLLQTIDFQ